MTATDPNPAKLQDGELVPPIMSPLERLQKACFDAPFCEIAIDHKWRAKAKHDGEKIGECQCPASRLGAQSLLWYLRRVSISYCRSTRR